MRTACGRELHDGYFSSRGLTSREGLASAGSLSPKSPCSYLHPSLTLLLYVSVSLQPRLLQEPGGFLRAALLRPVPARYGRLDHAVHNRVRPDVRLGLPVGVGGGGVRGWNFHLPLPLRRPRHHPCLALTSQTTQLSFPVSLFLFSGVVGYLFFVCRRRRWDESMMCWVVFFKIFFGAAPTPPPTVFAVVVARTLTAVAHIHHRHRPRPLMPSCPPAPPLWTVCCCQEAGGGERTFPNKANRTSRSFWV